MMPNMDTIPVLAVLAEKWVYDLVCEMLQAN